jgi:hypothetical protein
MERQLEAVCQKALEAFEYLAPFICRIRWGLGIRGRGPCVDIEPLRADPLALANNLKRAYIVGKGYEVL